MNNDWVDDYLMHHGILGQKWGVRRFQNADGSLTSRGRKRYQSARIDGEAALGKRDVDGYMRSVKKRSALNGTSARSCILEDEYNIKLDRFNRITKSLEKETDSLRKGITNGKYDIDRDKQAWEIDKRLQTLTLAKLKVNTDEALTEEESRYVKSIKDLDKYHADVVDTYERECDKAMARDMAPDKKASLKYAREQDMYNLDFLEAVQNEPWANDRKRLLKEYERFFDAGGFRGYRRDLEERRKNGKTEPQP